MNKNQDKGFTLVELLIVIVILGILATVTVFAVRGITDQGRTSACQADKKTIQTAIEAYYAQNGTGTVPTEADLVSADFLVEESPNIDLATTASGTIAVGDPVWSAGGATNGCGTAGTAV